MQQPSHVIDPNGEVIFSLPKTVPPFAPWPQEHIVNPKLESGPDTTVNDFPNNEDSPGPEPKRDDSETLCYTVQVSAKHLALASPVLKKCLTGPWKESHSLVKDGSVKLNAGDWDLEAFLLFMNIIHCRTHKLTRNISVNRLAQLATIVDYYDCVPAVKFFADIWIGTLTPAFPTVHCPLKPSFPTVHCREVMLWLCISRIFNHQTWFRKAAHLAITQSNEPVTSLGLPLPTKLLCESLLQGSFLPANTAAAEINRRRTEKISEVFAALDKEHQAYSNASTGCSFECRSMMLGALTLQRQGNELFSPRASVAPHHGTNYKALVQAVGSFKNPAWSLPPKKDVYGRVITSEASPSQHDCAGSTFEHLKDIIRGNDDTIDMNIMDYTSHPVSEGS